MNENSKNDDLFEISDKDSFNDNKEVKQSVFNVKKVIMNKKNNKKIAMRSKSVAIDDKNRKINKESNRYRYNDDEEQKNNINKKVNSLIKSGNLTKIFLKNKDYLLRSINLMKKNKNKLNNNNQDKDSIDMDEYHNKRRSIKDYKFNRNNSCINLRPKKKKKISVTYLKFATNVSKDNDGIILFENPLGANNCFLNAIIQVLYHIEDFKEKLIAINIKKEIKDPIFQVYTIFQQYDSLSKLNTIEMLNTNLLRKALHHRFGTYPLGKFADPIETILELLELIHVQYFEKGEKAKSSNAFCKNEYCPSHSNFLLYLKEVKFCPTCQAINVQKYDRDCFMFAVTSKELLSSIDEHDKFSKYKYSLFKKAKYISQKFGQNDKIRLDKCQCKSISTRKRLFLYKKFSPYMILNLTWDSDFPLITDICKIFAIIPTIDNNKNLFDLDLEKGKIQKEDLSTNYYLSSMILFGQRHYTCFFYNEEIKMWSFCDDDKKRNYRSYHELITYLISRRSFPVGLIYTYVNIFNNEPKEKYTLNEDKFNELYQNCVLEIQIEIEENEKLNKIQQEKNKEKDKEKEEKQKSKRNLKDIEEISDFSF